MTYQQIVMMLHRPSSLLPQVSSAYLKNLYEASSLSVDLFDHYAASGKVSLHAFHLSYLFSTCISLVYCILGYQSRPDLEAIPPDEIERKMSKCRRLLESFKANPQSAKSQSTLNALTSLLSGNLDTSTVQAMCTERLSPTLPAGNAVAISVQSELAGTSVNIQAPGGDLSSAMYSSLISPSCDVFSPWLWSSWQEDLQS